MASDMVFLLVDVYDNHSYDFIAGQSECPLTMVYPPRYPGRKQVQWLLGVCKVLRLSCKDDCLVFLYDFQAVIAWWICRLTGMRRRFVCINLLLEPHSGFRGRIISAMYRKALCSPCFKATVTSAGYGVWLNAKLGISTRYDLLREVFHEEYRVEASSNGQDVFCGGRNGRDWDFMVRLAASMPELSFTFVIPASLSARYKKLDLDNVRVLSSVPEAEFLSLLSGASAVCLPLTKQAPAGLIVLFQAAANGKAVLISDTVTTRAYCSDGRGMLLQNDLSVWREALSRILVQRDDSRKMASSLYDFCRTECSEEIFVRTFDSILRDSHAGVDMQ